MRILAAILLVATTLAGCTGEPADDWDSDGMLNEQETLGWTVTVDLEGRRIQYHVTSDPRDPDSDDDGIPDPFELGTGTDPNKADTDEDGLTDCQENFHSVLEDCNDPDWEGEADGGTGTIGNNADSDPGFGRYVNTRMEYVDETGTIAGRIGWGDGIPDGDEVNGYTITLHDGTQVEVQTDPLRKDTDGDNLEDGEEAFIFGTNPLAPDTDGDGCVDGLDIFPEYEEWLRPGLTRIEPAWPQNESRQLRFNMRLADQALLFPTEGTNVTGTTKEMDLHPAAVRPGSCFTAPYDAWVRIELVVEVLHEDGVGVLDFHSQAPGARHILWNPREQQFATEKSAPVTGPPWQWVGSDGALWMDPSASPGIQAP